jgi:hypothetical protein
MAACLLLISRVPADAQALDAITEAPSAVFRFLQNQLTPGPAQSAAANSGLERGQAVEQTEYIRADQMDRGPARAEEVLSPRLRAVMAKRDGYGAPATPTICTNCQ